MKTTYKYEYDTITYTGNRTISIGCHNHSVEDWLKLGEEIAKKENFNDKELEEYGEYIKAIDILTKCDIK